MSSPISTRPYMPGYGLRPADEGTGLLPWSWAEEKLTTSRNYWLVTTWPDGRPHAMPVWAMWHEDELWFSSSSGSRKARNLRANPRCVVATGDPENPVVVEGLAALVTAPEQLAAMLALENAKYSTDYGIEMLDPNVSSSFRIRPLWAFALMAGDFTGSPTRWDFGKPSATPRVAPRPAERRASKARATPGRAPRRNT